MLLGPLFVLSLVSSIPNLHFMPVLSISQCYEPTLNYLKLMNRSMATTVVMQFLHNALFFAVIFSIRKVEDKFNISKELRYVCFISTLCFGAYTSLLLFMDGSFIVVLGMG